MIDVLCSSVGKGAIGGLRLNISPVQNQHASPQLTFEHLIIHDASSVGDCLDTQFDSVHYSRDSNFHQVFGATIHMPACLSWRYM